MGVRYFCDRCEKEFRSNGLLVPIYARDSKGVVLMACGEGLLCEECAKKFNKIKNCLSHEENFFNMTDEDIYKMESELNMKIYMVELHDYDRDKAVGYFTEYKKAKSCCKYLNRAEPSEYDFKWKVIDYNPDETDYDSLNKKLDEQKQLKHEEKLERIKQKELAELARLKAKYE